MIDPVIFDNNVHLGNTNTYQTGLMYRGIYYTITTELKSKINKESVRVHRGLLYNDSVHLLLSKPGNKEFVKIYRGVKYH